MGIPQPLTPEQALTDLLRHVEGKGFRLSLGAESIFRDAEEVSAQMDIGPMPEVFLLAILRHIPALQAIVPHWRVGMQKVLARLSEGEEEFPLLSPYKDYSTLYSSQEDRILDMRTRLIDLTLIVSRAHIRREIIPTDVLEALLRFHEEFNPIIENANWGDERLHTPYNTLMHIAGAYDEELNIRFDEIRRMLDLTAPQIAILDALDIAPEDVRPYLRHLLNDHPNFERNCFLVMSFNPSPFHSEIVDVLRATLRYHGFNPLRADDRTYADHLLMNVRTYLHGCSFGVAVFERIETEAYNPNVSLEVGYFLGLARPVCLLKERTLPRLPSDLAGVLYREFDIQRLKTSIPEQLERWLRDRRLI